MSDEFIDNSPEVIEAMRQKSIIALEKCGLIAEGYAKKLCPVDTGALRNSITHTVDESELVAYVGSNIKYAPFVEYGTGKYVSGGRDTPWAFEDSRGNWHLTSGQKAQPFIKPSVADHMQEYKNILESELKG